LGGDSFGVVRGKPIEVINLKETILLQIDKKMANKRDFRQWLN